MGVFAEYQPRYASHGVATFPLLIAGKTKKPATKGYANVGLPGSGQLALKFPNMDAFAFMAGKRSGISVIDIDAPDDEGLLQSVLRRYGDTPFITRTGSGGFHCYYRHGGEGRKVRPDPSEPVDTLGGGVVAAAPSMGGKGAYRIIRGTLADLERLPYIAQQAANLPDPVLDLVQPERVQAGRITEGRANALFNHLMRVARYCDDLDALIDEAFTFASNMIDRTARHPFTDAEIVATARSVFQITERGDNRFGGKPHTILFHDIRDTLHELGPDAMFLHSVLTRWAGGQKLFPCANGMADHMPGGAWARKRFAAARAAIIEAGLIIEKRKASTGQAALFGWP